MPFEKFIPPRRQRATPVSIKRTGSIAIDLVFADEVGLTNVSHVTLHFDRAHRIIGLKGANDGKDEGAVKLSHRKRVCSVRARAFFAAFEIGLERTQRFAAHLDPATGMVFVELPRKRRGRPPKKRS